MTEDAKKQEAAIAFSDDLYTAKQASEILHRSERRVQQMCERGELECWRDGKLWAISQESVHSYFDKHGPGKPRGRKKDAGKSESEIIRGLEREIGKNEARQELKEEIARIDFYLAEQRELIRALARVVGVSEAELKKDINERTGGRP